MVRTLDAAFEAQKDLAQNRPITLYEIEINDSTTIYLAEYNEDIIFNGNTYLAFPLRRGSISTNSEGRIDQMTLSTSNVSLEMSAFIGANDMRNRMVRIITVFRDTLTTATARLQTDFFIRSISVTEKQADFLIGSKLDIFGITLPRRGYTRTVCQFIYQGVNCKYVLGSASPPDETTCDKGLDTLNGCRAHKNVTNFGGYPDIPLPAKTIFA